jgi:hypothetical protein
MPIEVIVIKHHDYYESVYDTEHSRHGLIRIALILPAIIAAVYVVGMVLLLNQAAWAAKHAGLGMYLAGGAAITMFLYGLTTAACGIVCWSRKDHTTAFWFLMTFFALAVAIVGFLILICAVMAVGFALMG